MSRSWKVLLIIMMLLGVNGINAQINLENATNEHMLMTNFSSIPLAFSENRGQWGERTLFKANAGGATFYFCADEVAYLFVRDTDELLEDDSFRHPESQGMPDEIRRPRYKKESMLIKAQFVGANPNPEVFGDDRLAHNNNYFYGNDPSQWRTDVPNYSTIIYKDIYPGIDLKYYGNGSSMKYDFIVNPGADISQIKIRYDGVDDLSVTHAGDLRAQTRFGLIHEKTPYIYQETAGSKLELAGRYELLEPGVFGFVMDDGYNLAYPLIIDPELIYSTFLGGSGDDFGSAIAVDGSGNAYIAGQSLSSDFPTFNPYDGSPNGGRDLIVTKLSAAGNSLIYSTYLGGIYDDIGQSIAVDGSGNACVTGETSSSDFPMFNSYDGSHNGNVDVFVIKLSAAGNSLIYSTYLGGSNWDTGLGIAVDGSGNAYMAGYTHSSDFPTFNPYDGNLDGITDIFVTKLSATGNSLVYSTYLGGSDEDYGYDLEVDGSGNAYLTGLTSSSDFPLVNPYDGSHNGAEDVFVTKLSAAGNSLIYSTYLGGSHSEIGIGIAVNNSGAAYVTGFTYSPDFPTVNPYDGIMDGIYDTFVTKLSAAGNSLIYSTYLGGDNLDRSWDIALDGLGKAHVTGFTLSPDFPTVNPYDGSLDGGEDVFVTKFSAAGNFLDFSTFLGGSTQDRGLGMAVDGSGDVYLTGYTNSSDFPTVNPLDDSYNGAYDAFVAKFGPVPVGACCLTDGSCQEGTEDQCITAGGEWLGAESLCLGDNNGNDIDDACEEVTTGACCLTDGSCQEGTENQCITGGGEWLGLGTVCLGDNNGNGIDDACEELQQVPTLSQWGLMAMGLLLLAFGTVAIVRKRKAIINWVV